MKYCSANEVSNITGLSRTVFYSKVADGSFPKPISLSSNRVAWKRTDLEEWIMSLINNRDKNKKELLDD